MCSFSKLVYFILPPRYDRGSLMRKALITLALVVLVLASGCLGFGGSKKEAPQEVDEYAENVANLYKLGEAIPVENVVIPKGGYIMTEFRTTIIKPADDPFGTTTYYGIVLVNMTTDLATYTMGLVKDTSTITGNTTIKIQEVVQSANAELTSLIRVLVDNKGIAYLRATSPVYWQFTLWREKNYNTPDEELIAEVPFLSTWTTKVYITRHISARMTVYPKSIALTITKNVHVHGGGFARTVVTMTMARG